MQWIYLICFILLSAGLLALFGVKPGDFIDALFRSQRKSATLSDELNVLLGTPANLNSNNPIKTSVKKYHASVARQSSRERNRLLACKSFAFTHANVHKHCRHFRRG